MSILDKYLAIEDNPDLYNFKLSYQDILLYPVIRFYLIISAIEETYNVCPCDDIKPSKWALIKYLFTCFLYRVQKAKQSDIVIFGSDIANIPSEKGYFNRLTEMFANEYPERTILVEQSDRVKYKRPRTYKKVYTNDFITVMARLKSLTGSINQEDLNQIELFIRFLKENFPHRFKNDFIWKKIKIRLMRFAREIPYTLDGYTKLMGHLSPQIILMGNACYGAKYIPLVMAAKKLKIPVGEYQHGIISLSHAAYNYSARLKASYLNYMPDFYLCYGKYWKENSRLPIKVIEIGNPYLAEISSKRKDSYGKKEKIVLYISNATLPEVYVREVLWLHENLQKTGYSVLFRIHPCEKERLQGVYRPMLQAGVVIDNRPLYETLSFAGYVIGDCSTVLFEAIPFNCIVFVRDSPHNESNMDMTMFNVFTDVQDVLDKMQHSSYRHPASEDIWSNSWKTRYGNFIEPYLNRQISSI